MNGNEARNKRIEAGIARTLKNAYPEVRQFKDYISDAAISTQYQYITQVNDFVVKANKNPKNLVLADFVKDMANYQYRSDGAEITNGAKACRWFALKRFSEFLNAYGYIPENYMLKVKRPKRTESEQTMSKREHGVLSAEEVQVLMRRLNRDINISYGEEYDMAVRNLAIFYLFFTTGIRQNALIALDLDDVDLEDKSLRVTDKGRKSRMYDLSDGCVEALKNWLIIRAKDEYNETEQDAVFITHKYKYGYGHPKSRGYGRIDPWDLDVLVKEKTAFTGRTLSPHKLRATYGTQLYNKTKDIYFVQSCMGHASPTTTEKYIRGIHGNTKKASNIMDDIMS